jgi:DNA-binding MarR family transcriptional regulator
VVGPGEAAPARPPPRTTVRLPVFARGQPAGELLRRELVGWAYSADQYAVESVIAFQGPLTPSQLAARLGIAPTTVSSWLSRLEAGGRIRRRPNPDDGRSVIVQSSAKGLREVEAAAGVFVAALRRVEAALGDDKDAVLEHAERLHHALRAALDETS